MATKSGGSKFNLTKLNELLSSCRSDNGDITLDLYLEAYAELNKMFHLLGSLFGFIVSDVKDKIAILEHYRRQDDRTDAHYQTVQSLIGYEVTNNITVIKGKPPSASRTLLRLHRALEFIIRFMHDIKEASGSQNLGSVAGKAYTDTLSKHHIWIVRKTVAVAMMTLSSRDHLLMKMGEASVEQTLELLGKAVVYAQPIYDTVQELYASNEILQLP